MRFKSSVASNLNQPTTVGGGSFFFQNHGLETLISTVIEALQLTKGKMEQRKIYAEKNMWGELSLYKVGIARILYREWYMI